MVIHVPARSRYHSLALWIGILASCLAWPPAAFPLQKGEGDLAEPTLPASSEWLTGRDFRLQLQKPLQASWSGTTLRRLTRGIAVNQRTCIFLDRRIDPDQTVDFKAAGESLERNLQRLAQQLNMGYCQIGPCIYLGPLATCSRLATVSEVKRQELSQAPAAIKPGLTQTVGWRWKRLSAPADLLQQQVTAAQLTLAPTAQLPHDLWKEQTLPPLDFAQRLSILLAGFNRTFQLDLNTGQLQLIPFPETVSLARNYPKRLSSANLAKIKARFPKLAIRQVADHLEVRGSHEEHELLARLLRGETIRTTTTRPSQKRFTLRVTQAPAAAIIDSIAQQQKLVVRFDPGLATKLQSRVDLNLKEATLDELLMKTLEPLGLAYQLKDQQLTIAEKKP